MRPRFSLMTFLRNLKWAFSRNGTEERLAMIRRVEALERQQKRLHADRADFRDLLLLEDVLNCHNPEFADEVEYCRRLGRLEMFPYERVRDFPSVEVLFDSAQKLPYVLHGGKRLYYPETWGHGTITHSYLASVAVEGILGDGCLAKSPHNYLNLRFPVKDGAVICDFGAAEGLVALHFAEQASRIVLGECDSKWLSPLRATFEPYAAKTTFVTAPLGMGGGEKPCESALWEAATAVGPNVPFFLKFDIEGAERFAIHEAAEFFKSHADITMACATYHRQDDAQVLEKMFAAWGYATAFSEGAMLFLLDRLFPPYFRHGILYARKD